MLLRTEGVSKQFNGVYALKDIDFEIRAGEVLGLVGENGAGKSTLIKILTGVYLPDAGTIYWNGQKAEIRSPIDSRNLGINVIHQDHTLIPSFNAVENIYLGREYPTRGGRVDWAKMERSVRAKAEELGIGLDYSKSAFEMSPPQKTLVEIIRAMMTNCQLLILDEPTASLTDRETELLFAIIGRLKSAGTAILYVTHRMEEIFRLTDRVTVLRNGQNVGTVNTGDVTKDELIRMMAENWTAEEVSRSSRIGDILFSVKNIASRDGIVKDASFDAHSGEILGIFGLGGSGRTELLESVYGYRPIQSGSVFLKGKKEERLSPADSIRNGVVLISEDRHGKALIGGMSVLQNITLSSIDAYSRAGRMNEKKEREDAQERAGELNVMMTGVDQAAKELSGGNQQKVVFARALMTEPTVYLCDEPTQAVDVMTRAEIHRLLRKRAESGAAVVYVSSDLREVLEVADSIVIMSKGRTIRCLANDQVSSSTVLGYCYEDQ